nr:hypothetical protein [uncultured Sphingomonas sp.]
MPFTAFLRMVLKLDGLSCLAMAALLVPFSQQLSRLFNIPAALLNESGLALIPIAMFIGGLGIRGRGPAALVWLVIVGNLGWVVASLALIASLPGIAPLGILFVLAQASVVLLLSALEARGLRQTSAAIA